MPQLIHHIIQYCTHPLPARQAEYDYCVRANLANPFIEKVHNLVEPGVKVPEEFRSHPKYIEVPVERWLTYRAALAYASASLPDKVVCLANLDIFLGSTGTNWKDLDTVLRSPIVLCLSRLEFDGAGGSFLSDDLKGLGSATTQDAWIFLSPLDVPDCDFRLGTLGCDNAFADRVRCAGRIPVNAGSRFKIFHYDRCRGKNKANEESILAGERRGVASDRAEEHGQYLLPDFDEVTSVDELLTTLNATKLQRYMVICDTMNKLIQINNRSE